MRRIILFALLTVFSGSLMAQAEKLLSESERREVMQSLTRAALEVKTLQCGFVQTKTSDLLADKAVSKGKMAFRSPNRLRWEYTEPHANLLVVNGDSVWMGGERFTREGSSADRIRKAVSGMVSGMVSGLKLFDENAYEISFYDAGTSWKADMLPKSRSMKRMFTRLTLYFDKQTHVVSEIVLTEAGGDQTSIRFREMVRNAALADQLFEIH